MSAAVGFRPLLSYGGVASACSPSVAPCVGLATVSSSIVMSLSETPSWKVPGPANPACRPATTQHRPKRCPACRWQRPAAHSEIRATGQPSTDAAPAGLPAVPQNRPPNPESRDVSSPAGPFPAVAPRFRRAHPAGVRRSPANSANNADPRRGLDCLTPQEGPDRPPVRSRRRRGRHRPATGDTGTPLRPPGRPPRPRPADQRIPRVSPSTVRLPPPTASQRPCGRGPG